PLDRKLRTFPKLWRLLNRTVDAPGSAEAESIAPTAYRAVVVGYGPIGQTVARLLREGGIEPVIIETNLETARRARTEGQKVVYGDATHPDALDAASIRTAVALVVSGPTSEQGAEIIRTARAMNPNLRVLARSYYLKETALMRDAG